MNHNAQLVPIDSLKPYPGNARTHDLPAIRESLRVNGQYRPVVVRSKTRHVLAGNGTLEAAQAEGLSEIWATFVNVDAKTAKRIVLVDNRTNDLAGYDDEALVALLGPLPELEGTGYSQADLDGLLPKFEPEKLEDQPRLDEEGERTCPQCGFAWRVVGGAVEPV